LELVRGALGRGDPEAALLHTSLALRDRIAELVEIDVEKLPEDLGAMLKSIDPLLPKLDEALSQLWEHPLELGAAVPLAPELASRVARICFEPPVQDIRNALNDESSTR
jgi:hypothetical protein